jgi:pSer/pThr/pTyr-binding forkhead associated (FHA) protein
MSEHILVEQAPNQGAEHSLESGTTIGREGCDIVFSDPDVSRRHAAIQVVQGEVSIEDLGSTNGTYVNGDRIDERRAIGNGDEVKIGSIVLVLRAPSTATRLVETVEPPSGATRMRQTTSPQPAEMPEPAPAAEPPATERMAEPPATERMPEPVAAERMPEPEPSPEPPAAQPQPAAGGPGSRGDVPMPDFQPSAIRRVVPGADAPTAFSPETPGRKRGSAATRMGATIMAGIVIAATTAGVLVYYITEPFK